MADPSRRDLLSRSYPTAGDGAEGEEVAIGDDEQESTCPCAGDGSAAEPSIYKEFWRDAGAGMERREYAKILATVGGLTAVGSLAAPLLGLTQVFERSYTGPVYSDGVALVDSESERGAPAEGERTRARDEKRSAGADAEARASQSAGEGVAHPIAVGRE